MSAYRKDGICPMCGTEPRPPPPKGYSTSPAYCKQCTRQRRYEIKTAQRQKLVNRSLELADYMSVVALYCQGLCTKKAARETGLSPKTITHRIAKAKQLTGCKTIGHLCAWAVLHGYYTPIRAQSERFVPATEEARI